MPHMRFFTPDDLRGEQAVVIGEEMVHMTRVMRARRGDTIELINGKGSLATGEITSIEKTQIVVSLLVHIYKEPPEKIFTLFQAMPKYPHLQLIIEKCTELGVDEIVLFESENSEKKGLSKNQHARIEHLLIASMKQCGRLYMPKVIEGSLSDLLQSNVFYGDLDATDFPKELSAHVAFVNGPEKGFSQKDLATLGDKGAKGISLSENILRTETAAIAATSLFKSAQRVSTNC